jgi:four helix bundle protein
MFMKLDEMPLYKRTHDFVRAIVAILDRPSVRRNRKLWEQLADANDSVISNFSEGYEQSSDAAFANFLVYSKASLAEVVARLRQYERRRAIQEEELARLEAEAEEIARMLGGFINYLHATGFTRRGTYRRRRNHTND